MPNYNVNIEVTYKSYHEEEIEAEDEDEAKTIAQENFYNDEYEDELRMNMETDNESYDATEIFDSQQCPVCKARYTEQDVTPKDWFYDNTKKFNDSEQVIYTP